MSALDILRRITRPMTPEESEAMVRALYGVGRENVGNDDPVAVQRARVLFSRKKRSGGPDDGAYGLAPATSALPWHPMTSLDYAAQKLRDVVSSLVVSEDRSVAASTNRVTRLPELPTLPPLSPCKTLRPAFRSTAREAKHLPTVKDLRQSPKLPEQGVQP